MSAGAPAALVEVTHERGIATLRLANPERRNVLDVPMATALQEAAERLAGDPAVRCVVITGTDTTFAAGADIAELAAAGTEKNLAYNRRLRAAVNSVAALRVPTIAALNGHAVGGGLELALACLMRIGSTAAKLGQPEAKLGIIPATGGLARLPILIPRTAAAEMLLTGRLLGAAEAEALGLLNEAVAPELVMERARVLAERVAAVAPLAAQAIVESLRRDGNLPIADANLRVEDRLAALLSSSDRREGAHAYLERRAPDFEGR